MNRLLIVDDEHHIVNWLAELFQSAADMDLEIMKAYSGIEMLNILQTYRMDVILLDIQMPGITGLEAAAKALEEWPETSIVFLTAYDNFDYLYQANQLPNTSYLLKTEDDTVILHTVKEVFQKRQEAEVSKKLLADATKNQLLLNHLMQQDFLRALIHDAFTQMSSFAVNKQNKLIPLDFSREIYLLYSRYSGALPQKSMLSSGAASSAACISFISRLVCNKFSFCMLELDSDSFLWFFQDNRSKTDSSSVSAVNFLRNVSDDFAGAAEVLIQGLLYNTLLAEPVFLNKIAQIFHQLQQYTLSQMHENVCYLSSSNLISSEDLRTYGHVSEQNDMDSLPSATAEELSFYLYQKNRNAYMELLTSISHRCCKKNSMHDLFAIQTYSSVALILIQYINQYSLEKELSLKIAVYPLYYIQDFPTWEKAFQYLTLLSEHLFSLISKAENNRNEHLISLVEHYVNENLHKSLSISDVASCINYNATYVSRLYRQVRGITLSDYITQCRIRKATHLLLTTATPIQNIARETGFDTSQYFSIVFKKEVGMSPRDYRALHLKG